MSTPPLSPEVLVPRFGDHLVEKGLIKAEDLKRALDYQKTLREKGDFQLIGQILIDQGVISTATREAVITEMILQLRAALQEANQNLEEANQQLELRVEQRTAELQRALEKLAELNQLKANIVANISHELRTPLTHLKGYVELLSAGDLGQLNLDQKNALTIIERSSERLGRLIDDLILFSVSERDEMNLHVNPFQPHHLFATVTHRIGNRAKDRNIVLQTECQENLPTVDGDEEKIGWVIFQLLDNAIKFTSSGGRIMLTARQEEQQVFISVQDNGMGIPHTRIDEIFESFYQLDGGSTRKVGGTGLGLALAKKIVEAHGSRIQVESQVNKGSCFTFSLKVHQSKA
jgi:signal transduction histidine kinase